MPPLMAVATNLPCGEGKCMVGNAVPGGTSCFICWLPQGECSDCMAAWLPIMLPRPRGMDRSATAGSACTSPDLRSLRLTMAPSRTVADSRGVVMVKPRSRGVAVWAKASDENTMHGTRNAIHGTFLCIFLQPIHILVSRDFPNSLDLRPPQAAFLSLSDIAHMTSR